ncbi:hypothetical protein IWQ60_002390 [Tieghemiomyces parasiticus]|uniref:PI31 proteasome regulator C-terminal domain-containing protein n=1 Tax=Tieghemiomyces parasiticus TaxID=78921 RepID=A0A9W8AF93_9FUNG|nr:hypothetical protein IWQ60_002390 [Tieghemiomyces parasiticus]
MASSTPKTNASALWSRAREAYHQVAGPVSPTDRAVLTVHAVLVAHGQTPTADAFAHWRTLPDELYTLRYTGLTVKAVPLRNELVVLASLDDADSDTVFTWHHAQDSLARIGAALDDPVAETVALPAPLASLSTALRDCLHPSAVPLSTNHPPSSDTVSLGSSSPRRDDCPPILSSVPAGAADLDPVAASPSVDPSVTRGHLPQIPSSAGGMHIGPDHPVFQIGPHGQRPPDVFGGPQPLPRNAVPPGARFDPIGPFGGDPSRLPGRGPHRGGPAPWSGDPDNDELQPPGYNDMFM